MVHIFDDQCLVPTGPPLDLDDDADNSSVYVQGLTDNVTLEDLTDFFKQCGIVKVGNNVICTVVLLRCSTSCYLIELAGQNANSILDLGRRVPVSKLKFCLSVIG